MGTKTETNVINNLEKLKFDVQIKFDKIREALNIREKLLLRQIDVILTTSQIHKTSEQSPLHLFSESSLADQEIKLLATNEDEVLHAIRSFGKFNLDNINLALQSIDGCMKNEDYIAPGIDHETMYKRLEDNGTFRNKRTEIIRGNSQIADEDFESIVVDFSQNKKLINESIINITLNEAKELIRKAKLRRNSIQLSMPPLNLEALDEALESVALSAESDLPYKANSSLPPNTKSSQTDPEIKKKRVLKPKITINNCNGTINLKNISNLTINCANEDGINAEIPIPGTDLEPKVPSTPITSPSSSTSSSSAQSMSPVSITSEECKKLHCHSTDTQTIEDQCCAPRNTTNSSRNSAPLQYDFENDDNAINCEFYNRLLNEIKSTLKQKTNSISKIDNQQYKYDGNEKNCNSQETGSVAALSSSQQTINQNRKLVLRNFENLKIILESNDDVSKSGEGVGNNEKGNNFHPVQIEQWLAEIISETEIEPVQNTEILEHSKIHKEMC